MKKIIITAITLFTSTITFSQTATDFTISDCNNTSHHLFAELDEGKIIVVAFVMPCGSCSAPSLAAYNAVQSYNVSNPGKVIFYLVDDEGNTPCQTLSTWATTNSMPNATVFSSPSFKMNQYGTAGMPKIVVMGGVDHAVTYNLNSGVTTLGVQNAVNSLLLSSGISENEALHVVKLQVSPNPTTNDFQISYFLDKPTTVKFEVFSLIGESIYNSSDINQISGNHKLKINEDIKLESGSFFLKMTTNSKTETIIFVVE